jgi:hypothetical protein
MGKSQRENTIVPVQHGTGPSAPERLVYKLSFNKDNKEKNS